MRKIVFISLMVLLVGFPLFTRDFMKLKEAMIEILPEGDDLFRDEVILTKEQAKYFNRRYDTDYRKKESFTVYYTQDGRGQTTSFSLVLNDILWAYVASHEWALAYNPDGSLRGIRILSLSDELTYGMADNRFLAQFEGLMPEEISLAGNIDAVSGATMSSELLCETVTKAWDIIELR